MTAKRTTVLKVRLRLPIIAAGFPSLNVFPPFFIFCFRSAGMLQSDGSVRVENGGDVWGW